MDTIMKCLQQRRHKNMKSLQQRRQIMDKFGSEKLTWVFFLGELKAVCNSYLAQCPEIYYVLWILYVWRNKVAKKYGI